MQMARVAFRKTMLPSISISKYQSMDGPRSFTVGVRYGLVKGEANIQSEVLTRGPVVCHMHADETFRAK